MFDFIQWPFKLVFPIKLNKICGPPFVCACCVMVNIYVCFLGFISSRRSTPFDPTKTRHLNGCLLNAELYFLFFFFVYINEIFKLMYSFSFRILKPYQLPRNVWSVVKKSEFSHIGPSYCIVLPTWLIVNKLYHVMNKARIPPVVCRKARVLSTSFVIVYAYCGVQHILCCVFVLFFLVLCDFCCQVQWIVHS